MQIGISVIVCSLVYTILLAIVYGKSEKVKTVETKIFSILLISNIIGLLLELCCCYTVANIERLGFINELVNRSYLIYYVVFVVIFTLYTYIVTFKPEKFELSKAYIKKDKMMKLLSIFFTISIIAVLVLPIKYYYDANYVYSHGAAPQYLYILCIVCMIIDFYCLTKNYKDIRSKKNIPLYSLLVCFAIVSFIRYLNPGIILITSTFAFVTAVMYFTMENPDVKMINELNKNRLLVNQTIEDKSNFLFQVSNQIKKPINSIIEISNKSLEEENMEYIKNDLKYINNLSHDLAFGVENLMDISTLSMKNIKVINNKYNLNNLINKIFIIKEKELKDGVEFRLNVSSNIPEYLYGDAKLLEQVIMSLLDNSIKYTEEGFIELNINTIEKYDMCRLLITIEDSGSGMSIDKVNELLMLDEELNDKDLKRLETKNIDINTIKKVISKMGGYLTIKSELEHGTEIKLVIDQKIKKEEQVEINNYLNNQNVLVASNNPEYLKNVTKLMEKKGYKVENSIYANDVLDRIRLKQKFSYIILDDELDIRAYEVLKELKKDSKFKIPVIIMIDKDVEFIKDHFVDDGFSDYIIKSDLKNELDRIFK